MTYRSGSESSDADRKSSTLGRSEIEVGARTYYHMSDGRRKPGRGVCTSPGYPFSIILRSILLDWHNRRGKETVSLGKGTEVSGEGKCYDMEGLLLNGEIFPSLPCSWGTKSSGDE